MCVAGQGVESDMWDHVIPISGGVITAVHGRVAYDFWWFFLFATSLDLDCSVPETTKSNLCMIP